MSTGEERNTASIVFDSLFTVPSSHVSPARPYSVFRRDREASFFWWWRRGSFACYWFGACPCTRCQLLFIPLFSKPRLEFTILILQLHDCADFLCIFCLIFLRQGTFGFTLFMTVITIVIPTHILVHILVEE